MTCCDHHEDLHHRLCKHIEDLSDGGPVPAERALLQIQEEPAYQSIAQRWPSLDEAQRQEAWAQLQELCKMHTERVLPMCLKCGACCEQGSPTLHKEDLELLQEGGIPWKDLYTLREGEPAHSPYENKVIHLTEERIKIRERAGSRGCCFYDPSTKECTIYTNRPLQCRAQACWDPEEALTLANQPCLTRHDLFGGVELLVEVMGEHEHRFPFERLPQACARLAEEEGRTVQELVELLAQEDHFRHFLADKLNIPEDNLDLIFGRSFTELVTLFGFRVEREDDGTRKLVVEGQ